MIKSKETGLLAAAFLAMSLLGAQVNAESRKPDAWITAKVKSTLAAKKNVKAFGTNVDTRGGVVTLRGEVETQAEKDLAGRYVREVEGVRSVNNYLEVRGDADVEDKADEAAEDAGDNIEGAGDRAIGAIGNAALTSRVKSALAAHRSTKGFGTDVDSRNGRVTLSGTVNSDAERDLAEKVARGVEGVKSVDNRLEVREGR